MGGIWPFRRGGSVYPQGRERSAKAAHQPSTVRTPAGRGVQRRAVAELGYNGFTPAALCANLGNCITARSQRRFLRRTTHSVLPQSSLHTLRRRTADLQASLSAVREREVTFPVRIPVPKVMFSRVGWSSGRICSGNPVCRHGPQWACSG